jgi:hypothetical protein
LIVCLLLDLDLELQLGVRVFELRQLCLMLRKGLSKLFGMTVLHSFALSVKFFELLFELIELSLVFFEGIHIRIDQLTVLRLQTGNFPLIVLDLGL